ncbi:MAG: trypsin-like peptidase domain-containing protein [Gemmatimonadaceae bacterium]
MSLVRFDVMARVAASALMLLALACEGAAPRNSAAQTTTSAAPRTQTNSAISASRRTAITEAVARVSPAVVTVQTEIVENIPTTDFFDRFFFGPQTERRGAGIGTGVIVRGDGVIVTNQHVVAGATSISVMLPDGTTYPARKLGEDELNDLAVLKVDARELPVAPLGNSDEVVIGEWAIAIGNPYGFVLGNTEPSVTAGVISATGRNLTARSEGGGVYLDMIQTDASINQGNSGGPLANANGEVIAINSSIYSPTGGSVGLGFAIPINRARRIVDDLLEHGRVRRAYIGEKLQQVTSSNPRDVLTAGVLVSQVVPESPAARAGLQPNDRIVSIGGKPVRNVFQWEAERLNLRVGDRVPLVVQRGNRSVTLSLVVGDLPEVSATRVTVLRQIELVSLTPTIRVERGIRAARGALVLNVSEQVRSQIGLEPGDVIVQVNNSPIATAADVERAVSYYRERRQQMRMFIERRGMVYTTDFFTVTQ